MLFTVPEMAEDLSVEEQEVSFAEGVSE